MPQPVEVTVNVSARVGSGYDSVNNLFIPFVGVAGVSAFYISMACFADNKCSRVAEPGHGLSVKSDLFI